ncbi:hypothetical protein [Peribacillus simplex]
MFKRKEIEKGRYEKINSLPKAIKGTPVSNAFIHFIGCPQHPNTHHRNTIADTLMDQNNSGCLIVIITKWIRSKSRRQKYGDNPGPGPLPLIATFLPW